MEIFKIGFLTVRLLDIIDIAIVGFILFKLYDLLKGGIGINLFAGILLFVFAYYLFKNVLHLELLSELLGQFINVGVLALLILFQPELRKFLIIMGTNSITIRNLFKKQITNWPAFGAEEKKPLKITSITKACRNMSESKTGALIVLAGNNDLTYYANSGDLIEGEVSKRLIETIFNKQSPMHDGAVIIQDGKIFAARCLLPITQNDELPAALGTRHRAAIGITEQSDAMSIIVSEETGEIAVAESGNLNLNVSLTELENLIKKFETQ
ncbi:MAG: TIGR00159 family protein [Bacteroidetes bacterium]|nr:TIGR00159 family protein [Bacteroidota bacterium]